MTADAVEQPTVPDEAVEAAAKALHDADCGCGDDHRSVGLMEYAELALAAAVPVIEKHRRAVADKAEARARLVADVEPLLAFLALFTGTIKRVLDSAPADADVIHIAITRSYAERLIKQVP